MKHPLSFLGGLAAGALLAYYMDSRTGAYRRALVRGKLVAAGHDMAHLANTKRKRAGGVLRGMLATHRLDRRSTRPPESDEQLHDRIRARLGHTISHPRAVEVEVDQGCVQLCGHVLHGEAEALCHEVQSMPGVRELRSNLRAHDSAQSLQRAMGQMHAPPLVQQQPLPAWH